MDASAQETEKLQKGLLLVEGETDRHVVYAICSKLELPENFNVASSKNDDGALAEFSSKAKAPNRPQILGLVLDADSSADTRWLQIIGKMKRHGYSFPPKPMIEGFITVSEKPGWPKIGVWLMPDNCNSGMLEDLLISCLEEPSRQFIVNHVDDAKRQGIAQYKDCHRSKAIIHSYLAIQDEPGKPLGQSITADFIDIDRPDVRKFSDWLQRLFSQAN